MTFPKMKSFLGQAALEELAADAPVEGGEEQKPADAAPAEGAAAPDAAPADAAAAAPAEGGEAQAAAAPAAGDEAAASGAAEGGEAAASTAAPAEGAEGAEGGEGGEGGEVPIDAADQDTQQAAAAAAEVENVEEPPVGDEVEGGDAAGTIAEEMAEVDAVAQDMEDGSQDLEKLQAATEHLTDVMAIMQASIQTGGMDPVASMFARKHVTLALESLNQPTNSILLPAMEDADTPSSKIGMAGDAIDAVKKFLARIAKAVADGFTRFGEWIATIWSRMTDANARLKARAQKLREMLKGAEMASEVTSASVIKGLATVDDDGSFPSRPVDTAKAVFDLMRFTNDATNYKPLVDAVEMLQVEARGAITPEAATVKIDEILGKMHATFEKEFKDSKLTPGANRAGADENFSVFNVVMPGLRVVSCVVPKNVKALASAGSMAGSVPSFLYKAKESSVPALSPKDADTLCALVIDACDWNISNNKNRSKSMAEFNAVMKKSVDKLNELARVEAEAGIKQASEAGMNESTIRFISNVTFKLFNATPRLPGYTMARVIPGVSSAFLDYVAASIGKKGDGKETQKQLGSSASVQKQIAG